MLDSMQLRHVTPGRLATFLAGLAAIALMLHMLTNTPADVAPNACPACDRECPPPLQDKVLVACDCPAMPSLVCPKCLPGDGPAGEEGAKGGEGGAQAAEKAEKAAEGKPQSSDASTYEEGDLEEITSTGAWKFNDTYVYPYDAPLAAYLGELMQGKTVLELGAGKGHYTQAFAKWASSIDAVDGALGIERLTGGLVKQADLTTRLELGEHDWVVCMEVGEHIPKEFELSVIDNIHRHNSIGVILSWAVLHQPGKGHINNHSNKYVKKLMDVLGYDNDEEAEKKARGITKLWWFEGSIMIFRRKQYPEL